MAPCGPFNEAIFLCDQWSRGKIFGRINAGEKQRFSRSLFLAGKYPADRSCLAAIRTRHLKFLLQLRNDFKQITDAADISNLKKSGAPRVLLPAALMR
jgi:hypothetical protein